MADTKISALTDGTTAQSGDLIPIARSGANYYITPGYLGTTLLGSTSLTGATVTTSQPVLNLSQTWNAGAVTFTGLVFNAAGLSNANSASNSSLLDLQVGGVSQFSVTKSGQIKTTVGQIAVSGSLQINSGNTNDLRNLTAATVYGTAFQLGSGITPDTYLSRAAAATLQLGAADAAAPVAQTLQVQSVVSGSPANTAGANFTIKGSAGNGNGAGGSIIFQVAPAGTAGVQTQNAYATALTIASDRTVTAATTINAGTFANSGGQGITATAAQLGLFNTGLLGWTNNAGSAGALDTILARDAADTLALRRTTTAGPTTYSQTFNIYSSYTDPSNYDRLTIRADNGGGQAQIWANAAGTGSLRSLGLLATSILFSSAAGANRWTIDSSGHFLAGTDNLYDIGAVGATRPRNVYVAGSTFVTGSSSTFARLTISSDFLILPSNATPKTLGGLAFIGGAYVGSGSTNNIVFQANTASAEKVTFSVGAGANDILGIGGGTSSFPALKRSSATLQVRLADDSGDAALQCGTQTAGGTAFNVNGTGGNSITSITNTTTGTLLQVLNSSSNPLMTVTDTTSGTLFSVQTPAAATLFSVNDTTTGTLLAVTNNSSVDVMTVSDIGTVTAPTFAYTGVTYANRPATPTAGMVIYITDSNTATWGATIAGGSTNKVLAWYNGTNWTVVGA